MATFRVGLNGILYRGAAGSQAGTEMVNVRDVTLTMDKDAADTTTRGCGGWKSRKGTLKDLKIEFNIVDKSDDTDIVAIRNASINNTLIALYAKDAADGDGPDADFEVTGFKRGEPLNGETTYDITCEASSEERNPTWS